AKAEMRPKLVLFGDSITEESFGDGGWAAALAHHFSRSADIVLRGYSGYNTRWALKVLDRAMDGASFGEPPAAVAVFFGANDASLPDRSSGFQHVPLSEYSANLRAICSHLKVYITSSLFFTSTCRRGRTKAKQWLLDTSISVGQTEPDMIAYEKWDSTIMILITPPPIDEHGRIQNPYGDNSSGLPERTNEVAGAYAKACVAVAEESGLPVIDIWTRMHKFPGWEKLFLRTSPREGRKIEAATVELVRMSGDSGVDSGVLMLEWRSPGEEEVDLLGSAAGSCKEVGSGRFPT
ncbi:hypothetical protein BHE74_00045302, partial [Ensete ventricosum]